MAASSLGVFGVETSIGGPMRYLSFMRYVCGARFVITDSGSLQSETSALNIPCLTVRPNTERPVTVEIGSNTLVEPEDIVPEVEKILAGEIKRTKYTHEAWSGRAGQEIVEGLREWESSRR